MRGGVYVLLCVVFLLLGCSEDGSVEPDGGLLAQVQHYFSTVVKEGVADSRGPSAQPALNKLLTLEDVNHIEPIELFIAADEYKDIKYYEFSRQADVLVSSPGNNRIDVWDLKSRKLTRSVYASGDVLSVTVDSIAERFCSITKNGDIDIFDLNSGRLMQTIGSKGLGWNQDHYHTLQKGPLRIREDGKVLAGIIDEKVALWSLETFELIRVLDDPKNKEGMGVNYYTIEYSPDGKWLLGSGRRQFMGTRFDAPIVVWEATTGDLIQSFKGEHRESKQLVFNQDGTVVFGNQTADAQGWDINSGKKMSGSYDFNYDWMEKTFGLGGYIESYKPCPSVQKVFYYEEDELKVADMPTGVVEFFQKTNKGEAIRRNVIGKNGNWAGIVVNGVAYFVDLQTGQVVHSWGKEGKNSLVFDGKISGMRIGPKGEFVALLYRNHWQKIINVHKVPNWSQSLWPSTTYTTMACALLEGGDGFTYFPEQGLAIRGNRGEIKKLLSPMIVQEGRDGAVAVTNDGSKVYFGTNYFALSFQDYKQFGDRQDFFGVWNTETGEHKELLKTSSLSSVVLDASEEFLSVVIGQSVYIFRTANDSLVNKIDAGAKVVATAINADEELIYIATRGNKAELKSFDINTGEVYDSFSIVGSSPVALSMNIRTNILYMDVGDRILAVDADGLNTVAVMQGFTDAFVITTTNGFFSGSNRFRDYVYQRDEKSSLIPLVDGKEERFSVEQVALTLNPNNLDAVKLAMKQRVASLPTIQSMTQYDPFEPICAETIPMSVTLGDTGGGLGSVKVVVSNSNVNPQKVEYVFEGQGAIRTFDIPIRRGVNDVEVIAMNGSNNKGSVPAQFQVMCNFPR